MDPYAIKESQWSDDPVTIPLLQWSDVILYMVSTPSPYTKESIKVLLFTISSGSIITSLLLGLEGYVGL